MLNIFSRRTFEDTYVRPSLSLQLTRTESIASDATAPNNTGAGRTLGLVLDAAGKRIEGLLNKRALRRGLTPQAIVEDIRAIRRNFFWGSKHMTPKDIEYILLKNLCRKLLKHSRSHVLALQLEALEAVTALAVQDSFVRQVLAGVLHHEYLVPKYREQELRIRSCKALISVKENEAYDIFEYIIVHGLLLESLDPQSDDPRACYVLNRFESLLRNPDVSFLMQRLMLYRHSASEIWILNSYIQVASTSPHVVEWETLRWYICRLKDHIRYFSMDDVLGAARYFPILDMYRGRYAVSGEYGSLDLEEFAKGSRSVLKFLDYLCNSEDLATQLQFLRDLDEDTRRVFQGTVFNEIHIALAHVSHLHRRVLDHTWFTCLETAANVLLRYYLCRHPDQQALAKEAITKLMKFSRYFKRALYAAYQTNDICGADMSSFELPEEIRFEWLSYNHCHRDLNRRHFKRNIDIEPAGEDMGMCEGDMLYNETSWQEDFDLTCWLEIRGDEYPFNVTGHFPILAGFDTSGKQLYVARIEWNFEPTYSYVPNGARSLAISDDFGEVHVFHRFDVLVLRHDPSNFGVTNIPADAKLQTGPVFWRSEEDNKSYKESFSWGPGLWSSILRAVKQFGDSKLPEIGGEDRLEDVTEFDSQEVTNRGSNENISEGFEAVDVSLAKGNVLTDVDGGEEAEEGLDGTGDSEMAHYPGLITEEKRQIEGRSKCPPNRRDIVAEKKSQIKAEKQALADRMRELEEEERELENEEAAQEEDNLKEEEEEEKLEARED